MGPKYLAMKERLLERFQRDDNAHAIVFVRTRADARVLHSIVRAGVRGGAGRGGAGVAGRGGAG